MTTSRRQPQPHEHEQPPVASVFDDALPENLTAVNSSSAEFRPRVHHNNNAPLSPYIIQLCRADQADPPEADAQAEALAARLALDLEGEELIEPVEDELCVERAELREQLRETDLQFSTEPIPTELSESLNTTRCDDQPSRLPLDRPRRSELDELLPETAAALEAIELDLPEADDAGEAEPDVVTLDEIVPQATDTESEPAESTAVKSCGWWRFEFISARSRALAAFVLLSFAVVLPLQAMQGMGGIQAYQAEITGAGERAIDNLMSGALALEADRFDVAGTDFARASDDFAEAADSLKSLGTAVAAVVNILPQTDRTYDSVSGLIVAGRNLSDAAAQLAQAGDDLSARQASNLATKLNLLQSYVAAAAPEVLAAAHALERVDPEVIPADYQNTVSELQSKVPQLAESMSEFLEFSDALLAIMGQDQKMRYLVVFQNNTELRATGGFAGSFAEMDVLGGEIVNINIPEGGTYDLQGQLADFVAAPEPLSLLNPRWEFHDANWFADFPSSAQKMLQFYTDAGGPTVDGVITINATLLPKLLEITGPIELPEYERTIDSENFMFEIQKIVEFEYEQYQNPASERAEEAPKQVIGDLAPKVLERLEGAELPELLQALDVLGAGLIEKDVMLYFESNALQSEIERLGWSGALKPTALDSLMVVNTNLGGGKTDTVIDQQVDVQVDIQADGSIINTVTITKEHQGLATSLFEGSNNVDYLRLYVPRGSELVSANGFEAPDSSLFEVSDLPLEYDEDLALVMRDAVIDPASGTDIWTENGKTVFGNWIQTKPGEIETVQFTYRLPFQITTSSAKQSLFEIAKEKLGFRELETYTIFVQKQPGVETRQTSVTLNLPESLELIWGSHDGALELGGVTFDNERDNFLRFLLEKK